MLGRNGFNTDLAKSAGLSIDRWPESNSEADVAEEAITKALSNLSFDEQEKIMFDLHGVDTTPSVCEMAKLEQLEKELSLIREKPDYDHAKHQDPTFVQNEKFRLMFLRAERFDTKKAAELMVHHFFIKRELFGDGEILARNVRLDDLDPDDVVCVRSGFLQLCPSRDAMGRTVILVIMPSKKYKILQNLTRTIWYVMMSAMKDEETQKKGIVAVMCKYNSPMPDLNYIRNVRRVQAAIPTWVAGVHYCYNDASLRPAVAGLHLFLSSGYRFRFRPHFGDIKDVVPKLEGFGIPFDENYPMESTTGRWSVEWHLKWLKRQEAANKTKKLPPIVRDVVVPRRFDVLFGKNKKARIHTGTLRCIFLVEMNRERYDKARKLEKTAIPTRSSPSFTSHKGAFFVGRRVKDGWRLNIGTHEKRFLTFSDS